MKDNLQQEDERGSFNDRLDTISDLAN